MNVICDRCRNSFDVILKENTKQIRNKENITRTYFECPSCKEQYDVCFDNEETLKMKAYLNRHKHKLKKIKTVQKYEKILKKMKKKQEQLIIENDKLETRFYASSNKENK